MGRQKRSPRGQNSHNIHPLEKRASTNIESSLTSDLQWIQRRDKILFFFLLFLVLAGVVGGGWVMLSVQSVLLQAAIGGVLAKILMMSCKYLFALPVQGGSANVHRHFQQTYPQVHHVYEKDHTRNPE